MNKISRKIEYAMMALKYMSQKIPGELTTAKEISDIFQTPFDATARVMQVMAQRALLRSEQGAFGGYQINKDLSKVSLHELIEMIEGKINLVKCLKVEHNCEVKDCNIIPPLSNLQRRIEDFYSSMNLKELLVDIKLSQSRQFKNSHNDEVIL